MEAKSVCANKPSTLVIDAGNTRIKWTLFQGREILDKWAQDTLDVPRCGAPSQIVFASVRSAAEDESLMAEIRATLPNTPLTVVHSERQACGVQNSYAEPHRLGVDRWLGAIAAYKEYGGPVVIIDAGTAIKADFVDQSGVHLGGYIVPGLDLMVSSLIDKTAKIRYQESEQSLGSDGIPHSTADAVQQGCLEMALGFVQRLHERHCDARWIATGGSSQKLMAALAIDCELDVHLVAKGAKYVLEEALEGWEVE
ncbi:Type III pantothenate kinase [Marinomonas aquimarina]|uniref:Type III pantothenate kinase n=1 Tax=Marinomonas aquimarina TaxID=295068 RepID=A0A1A8TB39_9GAMM|nr:type III pantothenate kinase [Marinomonas aquimarina]SBS29320.1 Type III pantothenate kinase [Marinomonas aquimarina]